MQEFLRAGARLLCQRNPQQGHHVKIRRRFFAEAHFSTACTAATQEARVSRANENEEWPEGAGAATSEGASRADASLIFSETSHDR